MRFIKVEFILVGILAILIAATPALALTSQADQNIVRAVMFWSEGCPHCRTVLTDVLPAIQDQYSNQLEIMLIEVSDLDEVEQLYRVAESLGYNQDQVRVPFLIIGNEVLIGSTQIPARLPGLIKDYLDAGGSDYPHLPEFDSLLLKGTTFTSYQADQPEPQGSPEPESSGMTIAAVIMIAMLIALVYVVIVFLRTYQGKSLAAESNWHNLAIPILTLLGLGVASYMTYIEVTTADAICGPIGDCNTVQDSPYATLFGVLPVGILGAVGYIAILLAWVIKRYSNGRLSEIAPLALFGMSFFGTLYSIYLTYLELFVIKAVCMWCLSSAIIITLLMLFSLSPAAAWVAEE
jgi:uncharacterized membrane protein